MKVEISGQLQKGILLYVTVYLKCKILQGNTEQYTYNINSLIAECTLLHTKLVSWEKYSEREVVSDVEYAYLYKSLSVSRVKVNLLFQFKITFHFRG